MAGIFREDRDYNLPMEVVENELSPRRMTFLESAAPLYRYMRDWGNSNSEVINDGRRYDELNKRSKELNNGTSVGFNPVDLYLKANSRRREADQLGGVPGLGKIKPLSWYRNRWWTENDKLRAKGLNVTSREEYEKKRLKDFMDLRDDVNKAFRNGSMLGAFAGGMLGGVTDPIIAATLPFGLSTSAFRTASIFSAMYKVVKVEVAVAVAAESFIQVRVQNFLKEVGDPNAGFRQGAISVALAGTGAGIVAGSLTGALRVGGRVRAAAGYSKSPSKGRDFGAISPGMSEEVAARTGGFELPTGSFRLPRGNKHGGWKFIRDKKSGISKDDIFALLRNPDAFHKGGADTLIIIRGKSFVRALYRPTNGAYDIIDAGKVSKERDNPLLWRKESETKATDQKKAVELRKLLPHFSQKYLPAPTWPMFIAGNEGGLAHVIYRDEFGLPRSVFIQQEGPYVRLANEPTIVTDRPNKVKRITHDPSIVPRPSRRGEWIDNNGYYVSSTTEPVILTQKEFALFEYAEESVKELKTKNPYPATKANRGQIFTQEQEVIEKVITEGEEAILTADEKVLTRANAKPAQLISLPAGEVLLDPKTFQFRTDIDALGATRRLEGVDKWDEILGGTMVFWERKDGKRFVVDGHQRVNLAKRLVKEGKEKDITLNGHLLREVDGFSAEDGLAMGTIRNLADQQIASDQTAIDAARVLRALPERFEEIMGLLPPRSPVKKVVVALMDLSNEELGLVVEGLVSPKHAAFLTDTMLPRTPKQLRGRLEIMRVLAQDDVRSMPETEAQFYIREAINAGFASLETSTMFGPELMAKNLAKPRARIVGVAAKVIRSDHRLFNALLKDEDTIISKAKNILDTEGNENIKDLSGVILGYLQEAGSLKGELSDEITRLAKIVTVSPNYDGAAGKAGRELVEFLRGRFTRDNLETIPDNAGEMGAGIGGRATDTGNKSPDKTAPQEGVERTSGGESSGESDVLPQPDDIRQAEFDSPGIRIARAKTASKIKENRVAGDCLGGKKK